MGAGDNLDVLHQTQDSLCASLSAPDFSHFNLSPPLPLVLRLLHASSVSLEQDGAFFTVHERLALQQGADKWIPSEQSITIYYSSEAVEEAVALIVCLVFYVLC